METLSQEEVEEYRAAFQMFDTNNDGTISTEELEVVMKKLCQHPTQLELQAMIDEVDTDGNGSIEFKEFCEMMVKHVTAGESDSELRVAFDVFDENGDGYISASELKKVMQNLGEDMTDEEIDEMVKEADFDEDGKISFEEFRVMMQRTQMK